MLPEGEDKFRVSAGQALRHIIARIRANASLENSFRIRTFMIENLDQIVKILKSADITQYLR